MTIRPGQEWGETVSRPDDLVSLRSDAALAAYVDAGSPEPVTVADGDLHRSLGAPSTRANMQRVPVDLLHVEAGARDWSAVAHVVARRSWWRGPVIAIMNVDHLGGRNVAPRGHPNDGRFDVVEVDPSMGLRQRLQARSRLAQGTHVPHPLIRTRTATEASWRLDRPVTLWVDGIPRGRVREFSVSIEPDAFTLLV